MKQSELCVLSLAEHKEWRRAYELERKVVGNEIIGSESDTRLYEIFDKKVPEKGFAIVKIGGAEYTVETDKKGGARLWRAFLSKEKPKRLIIDESAPPTWDEIQKRWRPVFKLQAV